MLTAASVDEPNGKAEKCKCWGSMRRAVNVADEAMTSCSNCSFLFLQLALLRFICFNWSDTWATSTCHMSTLPPIFADAETKTGQWAVAKWK